MMSYDQIGQFFAKKHHWYLELVASSKAMALIGHEPSTEEWICHGAIVRKEDDDWTWITWDGARLVGWRHPMHIVTDAMKYTFTFAEYSHG